MTDIEKAGLIVELETLKERFYNLPSLTHKESYAGLIHSLREAEGLIHQMDKFVVIRNFCAMEARENMAKAHIYLERLGYG